MESKAILSYNEFGGASHEVSIMEELPIYILTYYVYIANQVGLFDLFL